MSYNKITLIANLGREPELKYTPQGQTVCELSVATNEKRKGSNGEQIQETTWFKAILWGKQAEALAQYLYKGQQVYLEGRLRLREWTDKEGRTRTNLEISVTEIQLLGNRADNGNGNVVAAKAASASTSSKPSTPVYDDAVSEDDIPF
jgi:single-strand DNA-binding protein